MASQVVHLVPSRECIGKAEEQPISLPVALFHQPFLQKDLTTICNRIAKQTRIAAEALHLRLLPELVPLTLDNAHCLFSSTGSIPELLFGAGRYCQGIDGAIAVGR